MGRRPETELDPASQALHQSVDLQQVHLQVVEGGPDLEYTTQKALTSIGAHPSNDFVLDDSRISRFHCEVSIEDGAVRVRDQGSRNGTSLDGVRIDSAHLRDGSLIRIGRTSLRCRLMQDAAKIPLSQSTTFGTLTGRSVSMRAAFAALERAAASNSNLVILGETGTGKEQAARSVHAASSRADKPFVVVDCAALVLTESELFGHVRGAFTGAERDRTGAFELAKGGTIFLDEVGELPIDTQPKLLRVLEERTVQPVGTSNRAPIDVRVIAATHRDLRRAVNDGSFRADLYYRLAVMVVNLPSLRERPDDIPMITHWLLEAAGVEASRRDELTTLEHLSRLQQAAWPGNVRQLRNYLQRAALLGPNPTDEDVLPGVGAMPPDLNRPFPEAREAALRDFERRYLSLLMERHDHSPTAASDGAGVSRTYLYELLKRHGMK